MPLIKYTDSFLIINVQIRYSYIIIFKTTMYIIRFQTHKCIKIGLWTSWSPYEFCKWPYIETQRPLRVTSFKFWIPMQTDKIPQQDPDYKDKQEHITKKDKANNLPVRTAYERRGIFIRDCSREQGSTSPHPNIPRSTNSATSKDISKYTQMEYWNRQTALCGQDHSTAGLLDLLLC